MCIKVRARSATIKKKERERETIQRPTTVSRAVITRKTSEKRRRGDDRCRYGSASACIANGGNDAEKRDGGKVEYNNLIKTYLPCRERWAELISAVS